MCFTMRLFSCIMMNIQFKDEFDGFISGCFETGFGED
ncbi:hypothetical protein bas50_0226 [Escherichia phage DrSchubert]|uniref:Uncharacterized protein n=8 Tax=Vequintavirus TaxID=1914852 RepID=A0AAE8B5S5_9CAUD|nr:hypothetical protein bas56_0219 [Escherichia phage AlexBoehm]QXV77692.1 hypothetical protein bas50_0226 [Escherichia phage DrSchubert]QXV81121.1 hypothetical protein bas55_0221 [Escherichia phage JeffSchatz]QXV81344.1 hypothetical protein bas53_0221 [Escherichia phage JohannBauhin]QXV82739.1 hypothetical protein bas54_0219 [Escherichia phage MaxBurger]QXV85738.1 hypothetical protein bas51_0228 [Escherichia phage WalterGehring]